MEMGKLNTARIRKAVDPRILDVKKRVRQARRSLKRESKVVLSDEIIFFDDVAGNEQAKVRALPAISLALCVPCAVPLGLSPLAPCVDPAPHPPTTLPPPPPTLQTSVVLLEKHVLSKNIFCNVVAGSKHPKMCVAPAGAWCCCASANTFMWTLLLSGARLGDLAPAM
jgi:hypothetical protein